MYRADVAAAGKVYRQYRGRGRPRYKVEKKQNRPKDRSRSRGVVMRSQGSPRTTRPFRTGAVTKLDPLALFRFPRHPLNQQPCTRDQTSGQSPAAKNENRPPVLSRRPLPHARRARHADWYPHLLSPAGWQNRMGDEVVRVARASRAVSVVPRSRTLHFANLSISEMCGRNERA